MAGCLAMSVTTFAQDDEQKMYKVGDRVEVDPQGMSSGQYKTWQKGTVIKVGPSGGGVFSYDVKVAGEGDNGPTVYHVMTGANMIRPLAVKQNATAQVPRDQAGDVGPVTPPTPHANNCPPSDELSGTSQTSSFKRFIQDLHLHTPTSEQDYTATVTFQSFKIGAPHMWRPGYSGDGEGGRAGTTVYPVKTVFTVCKDHPGYKPSGYTGDIETRQDDNTYNCFKNEFGEWQCNTGDIQMGKVKWTKK